MHSIKYITILQTNLRHLSVQVYHLQGEINARFKTNCQRQVIIYKVPQCLVGSVVHVRYVSKYILSFLEFGHPRCVCNNEVEYNEGQNTTKFIA